MATGIICLILIIIAIYSIKSYIKKLNGGCCCGSSGPIEKRVRVKDKEVSHYPYHKRMSVSGMICGNCTKRVENALNSIDGVWAAADVSTKNVDVRMKNNLEDSVLKQAVRNAGYTVEAVETV